MDEEDQDQRTYYAPVICNHCPPPHIRGWAADSGANVWGSDLSSPPQCQACDILCKYTCVEFTTIKSRAMTLSRFQQCRAFSRALMDEKLLSPLFPIGGGGGGQAQWLQMTGALIFNCSIIFWLYHKIGYKCVSSNFAG